MAEFSLSRRSAAFLLGTLGLLLAFWPVEGRTQGGEELEAKVKSGFLLNFARYVEWPARAFTASNSPIIIGVLGQDNLGRHLDLTIEGKTIGSRPVQVKRARRVNELNDCHVLFVCASERDRVRGIVAATGGKPILTVSDMDSFTAADGMILLKRKQGTMRFEINREAAEKAGLKISSKLLTLADNYRQ